ncbi:MAG: hypothetical protein PVJ80_07775 [Gemmatimonadota bacterium]
MTHKLPERREALEAVAAQVGGTFFEGKKVVGGFAVTVPHGPWTLTLDLAMAQAGMVQLVHTRVVTHFASRERFRLRVRHRTFLDRLSATMGLGRVVSGDREFARRFVVKGKPDVRVRSVMSGGLGAAVIAGPNVSVEVGRAPRRERTGLGPGALRLQVLSPGVDTDVDRSIDMIDVARKTMDALQRSGVAS